MRSTLLVAVSLAFCIGHAQDFTKPITYTTKAIPFHVVLEDISKQSGMTLKAAQDLEEEPLILRLDKVPLKDAMDKMADVFAADWVDHHGFWQIERSETKMAKIRVALLAKRRDAIQRTLTQIKTLQQQHPLDAQNVDAFVARASALGKKALEGDDSGTADAAIFQKETPASRLCTAILSRIDPNELAAIPPGKRAVFSTSPNDLQKPLPDLPQDIFEEFNKQDQLVQSSVDKTPDPKDRPYLHMML